MARKFLTPIAPPILSSDPTGGSAGHIYYNNVSNVLKVYDGSDWVALAAAAPSSLSVVQVDTAGDPVESYSAITSIQFDEDSGFDVTSPSAGIAKIAMNSTFKFWEVDGVQKLTAVGLDTVNFISGSNISITADGSSNPQSITINADNQWTGKTTSDLSEGSNLYFTDERAQDAIGNSVGTGLSYNDSTGAISTNNIPNASLQNSSITINGYEISLGGEAAYSTDNISEGTTNRYFSDERARDAIADLITNSTHDGVSVSYTDDSSSRGSLAFTNTDKGSSQNIFKNIVVGATTVVADSNNDTLTIVGSNGVGALANATNDVIEIYNTGVTSLTGTANEVEVDTNTGGVIVGLPNNVTISGDLTVNGEIASTNAVQLDTSSSPTGAVGKLTWNDGDGVPAITLKNGNVNLKLGSEQVVLCHNSTGSTISKGSVVYINGAQGQRPTIALADADTESTSSKTLGIASESITNGAEGFVTTFGMVEGINTSSYTAGQALWLSGTAGTVTTTKPSSPQHLVFVGYCIRSHASSGRIFVKPQNGYELEELHNVSITSPTNNDVLKYNSSSSLWVNTDSLSLNSLTLSGDLTVNGTTTTVNSENLEVTDPLIYIGTGNTANTKDLGIVGHFDNGTYQHTGIVRDATDGKWKLFSGVSTEPTDIVDFTGATYDTLKAGTFEGNLTGNVTGNLTGNVTGDVSGNAGTVTNGVYINGSYSNPSWITGLAWSKISSTPTTISGYGITDGATLTGSQTLTNKTISGSSNTITNIGNSSLTNSSITINGSSVSLGGSVSIDTLPSQTGNSGKYLTTDGSTASWAALVVPITTGNTTVSSNTITTIDTTALSSFTSIEYMVSLKQGSKIRTSKVIVQTDGTDVDMTEFSIIETGGLMAGVLVSASVVSTNAALRITVTDAASTNVQVKFSKVSL